MKGKKYDSGKPMMYLLPSLSMLEIGKVLTHGAEKYDPENWRKVDDLQNRYGSAALRHIFAHNSGEELDNETELDHLAHAICCLLFKLEDKLLDADNSIMEWLDKEEVSRFEVIDQEGRAYVHYLEEHEYLETSEQDEGRTLKVFIGEKDNGKGQKEGRGGAEFHEYNESDSSSGGRHTYNQKERM